MTDWYTIAIAIYAAVVATAALALEIRRWIESRPKLHLTIAPERERDNGDEGGPKRIFVYVFNRGSAATTILYLTYHDYGTWWKWLRGKPAWSAPVRNSNPFSGFKPLPRFLEPGAHWVGTGSYDDDLVQRSDGGYLYVAIRASHSDKPTYVRIRSTTLRAKEGKS